MKPTKTDQTLQLIRSKQIIRPSDLAAEIGVTEHHSLAEASKRVPKRVICLLSALLTTQNPYHGETGGQSPVF